jgi:hypothetical protein
MQKIYLFTSIAALCFFSYAQHKGMTVFSSGGQSQGQTLASSGSRTSGTGGGSWRSGSLSHK